MESLDGKLGRLILGMTPAQFKTYKANTQGEGRTTENLVSIAESVAQESRSPLRESRRITRNNGACMQESDRDPMAEADAILFEGLREARPQSWGKNVSEVTEAGSLSGQAKEDVEFMKLIGLSESEAMKVVAAGGIRD